MDRFLDLHDTMDSSGTIVIDCGEFVQQSWQDSLPEDLTVGRNWIHGSHLQDSTVHVYRFTRRNRDGSVANAERWFFATANGRWYGKPYQTVSIYERDSWFKAMNRVIMTPVSMDSAVITGMREFVAQNECEIAWEDTTGKLDSDWLTIEVAMFCNPRKPQQVRAYMPLLEKLDALGSRPDLCTIDWSYYQPVILP